MRTSAISGHRHRGRAATNTHQDSTLGTVASDRSSLPMSTCRDRGQATPEKRGPSERRGGPGNPPAPHLAQDPEHRGFTCRQWLLSCTQKPTRLPALLKTMPNPRRDGCGTAQDSTGTTGCGHHARSPPAAPHSTAQVPPLASGSWGRNDLRAATSQD